MTIGSLGDTVFTVSNTTVRTLANLSLKKSASYAVHARHGQSSLTEFTGVEPETVSFDLTLSAFLGVDPAEELERLSGYLANGTAVPFILGKRAIGAYRWTVTSLTEDDSHIDNLGNVLTAKVSVTLQEYRKA